MKRDVTTIIFLILIAAFLHLPARALETRQDPSVRSQEMKSPQTAQEHRERAEQYQKKAAEYRQEVEAHRKMLSDYSKTVARTPREPGENAYIKKMRLHCTKYIRAAEELAREADEMAKYHLMCAKELEGR